MDFVSRRRGETEPAGTISVEVCISCPNLTASSRPSEGEPAMVPISQKRELRPEEGEAYAEIPEIVGARLKLF